MSSMTYAAPRFWQRRHRLATTATLVVLFWAVAALLVASVHRTIDPISAGGSVTAKIGILILIAFAYIKLTARETTIDHALFVGLVWVVLTIAAEMTVTAITGRGWFLLLGSPSNSALRYLMLFAWVSAPALFTHARP